MAADAAPREYRTGSDPRTLRDALGCFATGVTVVTCVDSSRQPFGFTANSFTSVSLDPPLLLVCIARQARCAPALIAAGHFAVNVLQAAQEPASIRFSRADEDRFGQTPWATGETGAPLLMDSLGVFECRRTAVHDGGDHHILIGEVLRASFDERMDPLLYFRGRYRRLHFD
jgi:flavin reductase (DIM6/NTAB) family NADH-FMN oxidoreductase RutF